MSKLKLAITLGSTCSGCDVAILDINAKIIDLTGLADIIFWPTAMDFKVAKLESLGKEEIDVGIYHGTIRTSLHEHLAHVIREKSKALIAFGSCACFGGIPGLCNLTTKQDILHTVFQDTLSTTNADAVIPSTDVDAGEFHLTLPDLHEDGKALHQVVDVDYYLPGCPPVAEQVEKLVPILQNMQRGEIPPKGTIIASNKTLCDECSLKKEDKRISRIRRVHEFIPQPDICLLEQGLICLGPATRGGCQARCIKARMPCRGCMGPTGEVRDQGAKMVATMASILGVADESEFSEAQASALVNEIKDPIGTFYRFTLPTALINRKEKRP